MNITSDTTSSLGEEWPPQYPDITISTSIDLCEAKPFAFSINGEIYRCRKTPHAIKHGASDHEFKLMKQAGDCSVKPIGRVMMKDQESGNVMVTGLIMNLEKAFTCTAIPSQHRVALAKEMIQLVHRLHRVQRIVHGDIKPDNMLIRRSDNRLVLCDFAESRAIDDEPQLWEGKTTPNYLAPNRDDTEAPTVIDDLYALGLSIWQLYSGKQPFADMDQDEISELLEQRKTVDLSVITDIAVRRTVTAYLRMGGAEV